MGIFDKAYAHEIGGTSGDHAYLPPITSKRTLPCGHYQGVTDQVNMSDTPRLFPVSARAARIE